MTNTDYRHMCSEESTVYEQLVAQYIKGLLSNPAIVNQDNCNNDDNNKRIVSTAIRMADLTIHHYRTEIPKVG